MLKFRKYSEISERDLKSSLQVAAHFMSFISWIHESVCQLFAQLFLLRMPQSRKKFQLKAPLKAKTLQLTKQKQ